MPSQDSPIRPLNEGSTDHEKLPASTISARLKSESIPSLNSRAPLKKKQVQTLGMSSPLTFFLTIAALSEIAICGRVNILQAETTAGGPSSLGGNTDSEGKYIELSNGIKGFIYMISVYSAGKFDLRFVPLDGSSGSVATFSLTMTQYKISLNYIEPSIIYFAYYGGNSKGVRVNIQQLSGTTSLTMLDTSNRVSEYSTSTGTDSSSTFIYVAGSTLWKRVCRFDLSQNLHFNHFDSLNLQNLPWCKFTNIFQSNFILVGGFGTSQYLLGKVSLSIISEFSTSPQLVGSSIFNNFDQNEHYIDRQDSFLLSVDIALSVAPNYLNKFPPLNMVSLYERSLTNMGSLNLLAVADNQNNSFRVISKTNFSVIFCVHFADGIQTAPSTVRGSLVTPSSFYFARVEDINKNVQQYFITFDNCTLRGTDQVCSQCLPDYFRTNLTSQNECILPVDFPALFGKDTPNFLMMSCGLGCLNCSSNFSFCDQCNSSLQLYPLDGICYSVITVPIGFGLDSISQSFIPCLQTTECEKCPRNFSECEACKTANSFYNLGTKCYTTLNVPVGYGLDTNNLTFGFCGSTGCLSCSFDKNICLLCDNLNGYFLLNQTCFTVESVPLGYGVEQGGGVFTACSHPECSNCSQNSSICQECRYQMLFYELNGSCFTQSSAPPGYGLGLPMKKFFDCKVVACGIDLNSGFMMRCNDILCSECSKDFLSCTECLLDVGAELINKSCVAPTCSGGNCTVRGLSDCQADVKKILYFPGYQKVKIYFQKPVEDLFRQYNISLTIEPSVGARRELEESEYIKKYENGVLVIVLNLAEAVYGFKLETKILLHSEFKCKDGDENYNTSTSITDLSYSPLLVTYEQNSSSIGAALVLSSFLISVFLGGKRGGNVSRIVTRVLSNFIWLAVIEGPTLLYPSAIFRFFSGDKSSLMNIRNPFGDYSGDSGEDDCGVYENYQRNNITRKMMRNYGKELSFLSIIFCINIFVSCSYLIVKRIEERKFLDGKRQKDKGEKRKKTKMMSILEMVNRFLGMRFFLMELLANCMKILCFVMVQFYFLSPGKGMIAGVLTGIIFIILYVFFTISSLKYVKNHKNTIINAMSIVKKDTRKQLKLKKLFLFFHLETDKIGGWDFIEFLFERERVPKEFYEVYFPIYEILRGVIFNMILLFLTPLKVFQVYVITIVQLFYVVCTIRMKLKVTMIERYTETSLLLLELCFCVGKIASFYTSTQKTRQEILGFVLAIVLLMIICISVSFLVYEIFRDVVYEPIVNYCRNRKITKIEHLREKGKVHIKKTAEKKITKMDSIIFKNFDDGKIISSPRIKELNYKDLIKSDVSTQPSKISKFRQHSLFSGRNRINRIELNKSIHTLSGEKSHNKSRSPVFKFQIRNIQEKKLPDSIQSNRSTSFDAKNLLSSR